MKKTKLLFTFIVLIGTVFCFAQKKDGHHYEKIKTLKINYISDKLNLTPEEAEKFWPIFNEYEKSNRNLRSSGIRSVKTEIDKYGSIDALPEEKALELSRIFIKINDKLATNKRNTFEKLESILSPRQLLALNFAEIEFNKEVLRTLKKKHGK